ncbi:hypothetical protein BCR43DRAFT_481343 [Syncephalastrum racemosum]|uniref:Uncharacterized protein n=1 Tax=Syncephalastrum racemosum TaxID=13706 RepID=A0A1X2HRT4_SYNRA|nr:hypothetical protein BCR43DRAFT_481343 [Syncephalastrum racemosum]
MILPLVILGMVLDTLAGDDLIMDNLPLSSFIRDESKFGKREYHQGCRVEGGLPYDYHLSIICGWIQKAS